MDKRIEVAINSTSEGTENTETEEIIKEGTTYGPVMFCHNSKGECYWRGSLFKVWRQRHRNASIYRQQISSSKCRRNQERNQKLGTLKKFVEYGLKKTEIMVVRTGKK